MPLSEIDTRAIVKRLKKKSLVFRFWYFVYGVKYGLIGLWIKIKRRFRVQSMKRIKSFDVSIMVEDICAYLKFGVSTNVNGGKVYSKLVV